ncbi:hypothetical protein [Sphingomonas sp. IW22]|uniref:hypothetical protein n=1 Tax=Sphingomonas sp. IW22 TaxID=3242489 RepID=UPI0035227D2E
MPDRGAKLAHDLALIAVDATEHPADAVTGLMRAAATILQRTFGDDGAAQLMRLMMNETFATWEASKQDAGATKH